MFLVAFPFADTTGSREGGGRVLLEVSGTEKEKKRSAVSIALEISQVAFGYNLRGEHKFMMLRGFVQQDNQEVKC